MRFSQRIGKTSSSKEIQIDDMDIDLRNSLWNIYSLAILSKISEDFNYDFNNYPHKIFGNSLWHLYFKKPVDEISHKFWKVKGDIKEYFFICDWYEVYDLIECTIDIVKNKIFWGAISHKDLFEQFNNVLEKETSGYKFFNEKLSPITNQTEINEIDEALSGSDNFTSIKPSNTHLRLALSMLSDRKSPDYRNSIKESISAIESLCKSISDNSKDSLGAAIDKIKGKLKIHPSLERGFKNLYGYTSDTDGIRHALTEETNCDFEDAKFMLVSCSAFLNYIIAKANKAGIIL